MALVRLVQYIRRQNELDKLFNRKEITDPADHGEVATQI